MMGFINENQGEIIRRTFSEKNIKIPYPQRELWFNQSDLNLDMTMKHQKNIKMIFIQLFKVNSRMI